MKTPITDRTKQAASHFPPEVNTVHAHIVEQLELDRAALMEALSKLLIEVGPQKDDLILSAIIRSAASTLVAVRANFPDED